MFTKTTIGTLGWLLSLIGAATVVRAESVFTAESFSGSGAPAFDAMGADPFDSTLGTLDSVHVQISGQLQVSGVATAPGPQLYQVEQTFQGLAGRFFQFDSPAKFTGSASAIIDGFGAPVPTPFQHSFAFNYAFAFTEATDFTGLTFTASPGAGITPPTSISGSRADFLPWIGSFYEIDMWATPVAGPAQQVATSGAMLIEYRYTPTPAPVPLPSAAYGGAMLLGAVVATRFRGRPAR